MIIHQLTLFSKNLEEQKTFFIDVLGFGLVSENENSFEIQTGLSRLKFIKSEKSKIYHFAFGIPYTIYPSALAWLKKRVKILCDEGNEVVDFPAWEAKALYFYDADKNICEFIARKELPKTMDQKFSIQQVYNIAEIGLVTHQIQPIFDKLHGATRVKMYDGSFNKFLAIGDYKGLFITIDKNKKNWFPTGEEAPIADFIAQVEILNQLYQIAYTDEKLEISKLEK